MPSRTLEDKVEDLTKAVAALTTRVDNLDGDYCTI
jgi:hypothetical protein